MNKVRQEIKNELAKIGLNQEEYAESIKVSPSSLTRFLRQTRETPPDVAAHIIRNIRPDLELVFMEDYCSNHVTKPRNIKLACEYASVHRLFDVLEHRITEGEKDRSTEVQDAVKVYKMVLQLQRNEVSPADLYEKIRYERVAFPEMQALLRILELSTLLHQKQYSFLIASAGKLEDFINNLEIKFFRTSLKARLYEILQYTSLKVQNDPSQSLKYSKYILKAPVSRMHKANSFHSIASGLMLSDVEKAIKYYEKSKKCYLSIKHRDIAEMVEYNLQFAKVLWGIEVDIFIDKEIKAFHLIKNNEIEKGLALLENCDDSPIVSFIKGEAGDLEEYWKSMHGFIKRGDKFLANLPKVRLIATGESETKINALFDVI
jgi:transcriptional regulator with XRE-family HTH domain